LDLGPELRLGLGLGFGFGFGFGKISISKQHKKLSPSHLMPNKKVSANV